MSTSSIEQLVSKEYQYGFSTDIEADTIPKGLNEDVVRVISAKKNEPAFMLEWRLKAFRRWQQMVEPRWPNVKYEPIDYQGVSYYSAPRTAKPLGSLDELDPKLRETYNKLGIPLNEQKMLAGVAVDAVFDSVSVGTTYKAELRKHGVIFCSFGEAVQEHPELIEKYLGSVVPYSDNYFAALNSAVFSDGSFVYVPKGVRCPMELSTYFRINAADTGQFERTLIIADEGAYVSYLEGCTAPKRSTNQLHAAVVEIVALDHSSVKYSTVQNWYAGDENQLHAAVVELVAHDNAQIKYSTVQNWYAGDAEGKGGIFNFVTKRGKCAGVNSKIS
ncbi:MAG: Fe-S cluster assembly protein SufB, partial [Cytophagaceae bacterium]|nr:Fe-S cluster assembly protein SufB [Gemmatimonadaceae bacterium]